MNQEEVRKAFQSVFGSWAGTLVAQGRADEEIADLLNTVTPGITAHCDADVAKVALRAKDVILTNLPKLRAIIPTS
jgi:hypothetical protein